MTHNHFSSSLLKKLGIVTLVILFLFCGTAAAGSIFIDTTGITAKAGETIQVPVMITTSGEPLYNTDLQIHKPDNAEVKFNQSSLTALGGMFSANDETGLFSGIGFSVQGTNQVFFYLDVTPNQNTKENVELDVTITKAGEGTLDTVKPKDYTTTPATLTVEGAATSSPTPTQTSGNSGSSGTGTPTVAPTPTQTATSTPSVTATQTEIVPTGTAPTGTVPTLQPSATTPAPTPVPILGFIAGLGAALCIVRRP